MITSPQKIHLTLCVYEKGQPTGDVYDYYPNEKMYRISSYTKPAGKNSFASIFENPVIQTVYDSTGTTLVKDGNGHYPVYSDDYKTVLEEGEVKEGKKTATGKAVSIKGT